MCIVVIQYNLGKLEENFQRGETQMLRHYSSPLSRAPRLDDHRSSEPWVVA